MIGELSAGQPVLPVVRGPYLALVGVGVVRRRHRPAPGQRDIADVTLSQQRPSVGLATLEPQSQVASQGQFEIDALGRADTLVVAVVGVFPAHVAASVIEHRLAVHRGLHFTGGTAYGPQEDVLCLVVVGGPTVGLGPVRRMVPRADQQSVSYDDPSGRSTPAGLQDHGARQVTDICGHGHVDRSDTEHAGVSTKHPSEDARRVKSRNAHPFHSAVGRYECVYLPIAQKPVVADRR